MVIGTELRKKKLANMHNLFIVSNQTKLTFSDKCKSFDSLVGSILNYNAEVSGYNEGKHLENIHSNFFRKNTCVRKFTNHDGSYGELGRHPMRIQRKIIIIKYWFKILKLSDNCLLKHMYNFLVRDA